MKEQETLLLAVTPGKHSQLNPNDKDKIFLGIARWAGLNCFFFSFAFRNWCLCNTKEIQNGTLSSSMILIAAQLFDLGVFSFPRALIFYIAFFPVVLQVTTKALLQTNTSSGSWVVPASTLYRISTFSGYFLHVKGFHCFKVFQWSMRNHTG